MSGFNDRAECYFYRRGSVYVRLVCKFESKMLLHCKQCKRNPWFDEVYLCRGYFV